MCKFPTLVGRGTREKQCDEKRRRAEGRVVARAKGEPWVTGIKSAGSQKRKSK
jgi:hypothetical protein